MVGSTSVLVLAGLCLSEPSAPPKEGFCIDCHKKQEELRLAVPTTSVAASVHKDVAGGCVICHGGDVREPTKRAHDPRLGFRGKPGPADVPRVCGGCHADAAYIRRFSAKISVDQLSLYRVSAHGIALEQGKTDVATCVSCHGFHDVRRVNDPEAPVSAANVATTCGKCHGDPKHRAREKSKRSPVAEWKKSVHAKALLDKGDLTSPTCNDCHGDHGAAPPGTGDIHYACGACHAQESQQLVEGPHGEPFARLGFAECVECHGNHDVEAAGDALLTPTERGVCRRCHKEGTPGADAALAIHKRLVDARKTAEVARSAVRRAKEVGLFVPDAEAAEADLHTALSRMRISVHGMKPEALDEDVAAVNQTAGRMEKGTSEAFARLEFRRKGHVIFVLLVSAMVGLLLIKIRRLGEA